MEEQIMNMPAVALRGLTILPGMIAHFDISRERSLRAVEEAMEQDQKIYLVTQRNVNSEDPTQEDLYQMGIVADIKQVVRLQNDVVRILVDGISRAALLGFTGNEKYLEAEICYCDSNADSLPEDLREAMLLGVREAFHRYAAVVGKISKELISAYHLQVLHHLILVIFYSYLFTLEKSLNIDISVCLRTEALDNGTVVNLY